MLQTVNGAPLPYVLLDLGDTYRFIVLSHVLTFRSGGAVSGVITTRTIQFGSTSIETQTATGFYTVNRNAITVTWPQSGDYEYTSTGNGLSVFEPIFRATWVYRKE